MSSSGCRSYPTQQISSRPTTSSKSFRKSPSCSNRCPRCKPFKLNSSESLVKACPPRCCEGDFFTPHLFLGKGAGVALFALAAFRDFLFYPFFVFFAFNRYNIFFVG